jgi:hypothetical protein
LTGEQQKVAVRVESHAGGGRPVVLARTGSRGSRGADRRAARRRRGAREGDIQAVPWLDAAVGVEVPAAAAVATRWTTRSRNHVSLNKDEDAGWR